MLYTTLQNIYVYNRSNAKWNMHDVNISRHVLYVHFNTVCIWHS